MIRAAILSLAISLPIAACQADPAPQIYYSPVENLERIDVGLIDGARREINMAAYVLTDVAVIHALIAAAERGVTVRVVLYVPQIPTGGYVLEQLKHLRDTKNVSIRYRETGPLMHLKSYAIDGHLLRTGSANFSASGEKHQDNDLVVIESAPAAAGFQAQFERVWKEARP